MDWWALGVLMFSLLTGESPFDDGTSQLLVNILKVRFVWGSTNICCFGKVMLPFFASTFALGVSSDFYLFTRDLSFHRM